MREEKSPRGRRKAARPPDEPDEKLAPRGRNLPPHLRPLYRQVEVPREDWGLPSGAVIAFAHSLTVPAGKFIGEPLRLRPFQMKFIRRVYNELYDDGRRKVRQALLSIARRGGKTLLASVLLLCHLVGPMRKQNSTIISAATTRKQAGIVFKFVASMVRMNKTLARKLKVIDSTKRIVNHKLNSAYEAISAEATGAFGEGIDFCIYDELAQAKTATLYEALMTSLGSQVEPLMMIISTQAPTDAHLLSELIDYGKKIDSGIIEDENFVSQVYAAPMDCDLLDESAWHAANPTLGDYRDIDEFRSTMNRAVQLPALENSARNLYLNQRVSTKAPFLTPAVWARNAGAVIESLFHDGRPVYAGLDLSARTDLSALVLAANDDEGNLHYRCRVWTPADTIIERGLRDRAPYKVWGDHGFLIPIPGPAIDYDFVAAEFGELCRVMNIVEVCYDRWRIDVLKQSLARFGLLLNLRPHGQGFADMGPACDMLEQLALEARLRHGDDPVLKWCMSNAVVSMDAAGNRKLDKSRAFGRIDVAVAALMATTAARLRTGPERDISSWIG
jgi:phage terminase large subunit-like protein